MVIFGRLRRTVDSAATVATLRPAAPSLVPRESEPDERNPGRGRGTHVPPGIGSVTRFLGVKPGDRPDDLSVRTRQLTS